MASQLGKYEIRRELGRGAMGVVYEAYDPLIKRRVALKTIRPDQLAGEHAADIVARFRREAQAAGRLTHPNIVSIYDFAEDGGTWFIAMEYVDGRELKDCFASDERFRPADIERIMSQILAALDYSHRQGVVHRDIKPANIFLLADGTVKVADFGIAHIEASNLTQVGTVVGTPNYMSPEQIMGLPVDGRSDLFSTGVILYQFLTGERPFAGSTTTTMQKVLKEDPLPPSTLNVQLPDAIDTIVRKALAKRPDDRFQTAREFANALTAAMPVNFSSTGAAAGPDPDATLPARPTVARTAAPARSAVAAAPMPVMRASQSTAMIIVAAIAVVGIAALAATWWLWPRAETTVAAAKPTAPGQPARDAPRTIAPSPEYATPQANAASASPRSAVAAAPTDTPATPGTLVISAVGLADPSDPRYANDKSLVQTDARADSKQQLVAKALALLLDRESMATNYELLQSRVVAKSGDYITTVMREGEPQLGKDGLMWVTTQAVVNVKAVQQSLNRMSRDERVELIRAHGDPRIALRITMRDADRPDVPSQPSPLAENILKERIKSFGFRTWSDDGNASTNADFLVVGEASVRRFSTRLAASGLVVTKYGLSSWTVKCTNRVTGEEVYFNTALPKGAGTWASEEEALRAIGNGIADQFNRNLFLQHVNVSSRKIALVLSGMPDAASEELLARELVGLPSVISVDVGPQAKPRVYDVQVALPVSGDAIASEVIAPLNAKAGAGCFALGAIDGDRVAIALHPRCAEGLRARLETNPPAGLYGAPAARQKAVIKNPEMLRRLAV